MADFVLAKKKTFTFSIEGSKKVYELPPVTKLPIREIAIFQKIQEIDTDDVDKLEEFYGEAKDFVLKHLPELENVLGDYEFMQVFGAYAKSQGKYAGES